MAKKDGRNKRQKYDLPTGIVLPGRDGLYVVAHITGFTPGKKGTASVSWQLRSRSGRIVDRAIYPRTHKYDPDRENAELLKRLMVAKAEDAFRAEYKTFGVSETTVFATERLFSCVLESLSEEEWQRLRKPTWADTTWNKYRPMVSHVM